MLFSSSPPRIAFLLFFSSLLACAAVGNDPGTGTEGAMPSAPSADDDHHDDHDFAPAASSVAASMCTSSMQVSSSKKTMAAPAPRDIIPAPGTPVLTDADKAKFVQLPHAVPVLLFHQICPTACVDADTYGMTQAEFQRTMLMLKNAGYTTISSAEYVRFLRNEWAGLPSSPIYVTFDDGRLDAYRGADDVLRATGTKATMFVITGQAEAQNPFYMSWSEIAAAQASGRWDIQLHGGQGHSRIPARVDVNGNVVELPYYANRRYDPVAYPNGDHLEPLDAWRTRAQQDVLKALALLKQKVPGFTQLTFAVPFGDYGQQGTSNDPAIAAENRAWFGLRFAAWFTQPSDNPDFNVTSQPTKERPRYTIKNTTTADSVYAWLNTREIRRARTPSN
jgi:hypothetical protein